MAKEVAVQTSRQLSVTLDREALKQAVASLVRPDAAKADWCVACGAGKSASPLEKTDWVQNASRDLLQGKSLSEFVDSIKNAGLHTQWCVACGAGKEANPLDQLVDPAELSDEVIEALAQRLVSAVKVE